LAAGGTNKIMLKHIITDAIDAVSKAGGQVKAIICDQGANNRALFSELGVTIEQAYFVHESKPIICMFDPPHLFKSVRNNLVKYDLHIGKKIIK
jgi:hypothetical protein